ncbi:acetolactate synthase, large subunit, biosynthetic type [Sporanaerobium hydrogeniformans]|uniref:Acetolactate synthase, large subunit, biosynthetic type n=1 Tax=Sporanaerobium hydrogeniformans TaxID=3072179 RepID=A0AC61DFQ7_9FIRM|nr:biosynthetic-type acetolactate synthase large subunit [Sporanaerobium hydrogeniformans]PHV72094.1 acetolactate synthase, large subunit, biosynthetic type [Sporanaerobium hydrogeniformans]
MNINGSQILIECLVEQGVDTVFGYPGGQVLNIYDALYKNKDRIRHILTAHEQGASHAADGYARATGKVGVCIATSGPGATNLVTGIATAYMDSVPMVAITGNVPTPLLGKDSFQEVDISGITMPITKHNYIVKDVTKLADTIREAFYIAQSGRPGPVLIDIPKDISAQFCEYEVEKPRPIGRTVHRIKQQDIEVAVSLLKNARKPFIYSGGGIIRSDAHEELLQFAEKLQAPVATSLMGIGGFAETHPLATGLIGMHGSKASNLATTECDLLIALGARFSDRVISDVSKFAPHAKILHVDIDPAEVGKNVKVYSSVIGDVREILTTFISLIPQMEHDAWIEQVRAWKEEFHFDYQKDETLRPEFILENIYDQTQGEAIITTEVGQHQMWAAQFFKYTKPKTFISSGGLGTMGYGTGASIGAQIGKPEMQVVHIAGDGSFRMNCNELSTIAYYNIPVIIVIMNNATLGMVRQWQTKFYEKRYAESTLDRGPDFALLAQAYGVTGYTITSQEEFSRAFKEALESNKPAVLNCQIGIDEMVLPMVAPGAAIHDLILE